ncbi:hypothetical protein CPC08DRAFT_273844 [Agrocybe pediades]|nr:hypothetical protein CPC08DRAFT_273844 [Agrocybe pediades]
MNLSHSIVSGGTFIQNNYTRSGERPGYIRLLENVATAALHDSVHDVDPPKCYPNTRMAIIQSIMDWSYGTDKRLSRKPIMWLKGGAGAGKSAIARSVAERCSDEGLLLGAFFFGAADPRRNHVGRLVATLSYQIGIVLPAFRDVVASLIEQDPLIFERSIRTQLLTLVIRPLSLVIASHSHSTTSATTSVLIILDGLDECDDPSTQQSLVLALQEIVNTTTLQVRFLICSRPESHLNNTFSRSHIVPILHSILLDDDYTAKNDIRLYLEDKFRQIKEGHVFKHTLPDPWPTPEAVDVLVNKSSGQFIYAATIAGYIESPRHRPDQRLNAIFNLRPPFKDLPFKELDALYKLIISRAEDLQMVLDILTFPALYGSFALNDIEAILQLEKGSAEVMLADLFSIVTISAERDVSFLHKSLADFLAEPQRAGDLYLDLPSAQLSHVARLITIFSTHCCHPTGRISNSWSISHILGGVLSDLAEPNITKADYISPDMLQAAQQFSMFDFFKPLLPYGRTEDWNETGSSVGDLLFVDAYFRFLYRIKDICESTKFVYWGQIRQYCQSLSAAVLDDSWSSNCKAHFVYTYYHLLHDPRYQLPRKLSHVNFIYDFSDMDVGVFGDIILHFITMSARDLPSPYSYSDDMVKICYDLMEDVEKDTTFAKSASFCLALLCNEQRANMDRLYDIARQDRHKNREHPWHWRRTVPRPPSVGNQLTLVGYREGWDQDYKLKLTRLRNALQNRIPYRYENIQLITMHEYFQIKSEPVPKTWSWRLKYERPQQWPLYTFSLDLLPYILPLSGRYEPLVTMCRKNCFSSLSQFWPKKSRRARQAINDYLRRVDSQEVQ